MISNKQKEMALGYLLECNTMQDIADNAEVNPKDRIVACRELLNAFNNIQRIGQTTTQDIREDNFMFDII